MTSGSSSPTRCGLLAASAAAGAISVLPSQFLAANDAHSSQLSSQGDFQMATTKSDAIRPFSFHAPESELADLRRRILATRLPEKEPVTDHSQGVPLATIRKLQRYWATEYDWRKCEAKFNAFP